MKFSSKIIVFLMISFMTCFSTGLITATAVGIANHNHDSFFDASFLFLDRYSVNDLIAPVAAVMAVLGWLCGLFGEKLLLNLTKISPGKEVSFTKYMMRFLIVFLPGILIIIVLMLFGGYVQDIYNRTQYSGLGTFARGFVQFFMGGFFLGISTFIYGTVQQQEQKNSPK